MPKQNLSNSQSLVAVEDIKQSTVVLKDGSLRQVIMVGGVNFSLKSPIEQDMYTEAYQNFLNGLNFPIQIIIHSRKINIDNYLKILEEKRGVELSPLLKNQILEYGEFIKGFVHDNDIMSKTFFVVVPFTPTKIPTKSGFLKLLPFGKKSAGTEAGDLEKNKNFSENREQLSQRATQVVEGLISIGLNAIVLDDEALAELFYNFYNPGSVERKNIEIPH